EGRQHFIREYSVTGHTAQNCKILKCVQPSRDGRIRLLRESDGSAGRGSGFIQTFQFPQPILSVTEITLSAVVKGRCSNPHPN
ncbi:hypothetical protein BaRGS_00000344, partial [Batillaria attramentaria]